MKRELSLWTICQSSRATGMVMRWLEQTYPVLAPFCGVPDDVVASLMIGAQHLRGHVLIFREPDSQLLVPAPVTRMPERLLAGQLAGGMTEVSTYNSTAASCCFRSAGQL